MSFSPPTAWIALGCVVLGSIFVYFRDSERKNEPPVLPGGLPFLGHALDFSKDSSKLYSKAWYVNICVTTSYSRLPLLGIGQRMVNPCLFRLPDNELT